LVETGVDNEQRVIKGLMVLPDRAVREMKPGDVAEYGVVRVADEVLMDLMKSGCGVTYQDAIADVVWKDIEGVRIPFASPATLWRMKQTPREKDIPDQLFLRDLLNKAAGSGESRPAASRSPGVVGWLKRLFGSST